MSSLVVVCGKLITQITLYNSFLDNASVLMEQLDERVVNMYKQIKQILMKYRSGKLPKAFKIVPALKNWEQVCRKEI